MKSLWEELIRTRAFWLAYVSAGVEFTGCKTLAEDERASRVAPYSGARFIFPFPNSDMLMLDISEGHHSLELYRPFPSKRLDIGRMDCHQMSDAFRWDEFQALMTCLAKEVQPTWAIQLLFCFYVAVTEDIAGEYLALLEQCLGDSEIFSANEIQHILNYTRTVAIRKDFQWIKDSQRGWAAEGRDAYCMRHVCGGFDFDTFNTFIAAVGHA